MKRRGLVFFAVAAALIVVQPRAWAEDDFSFAKEEIGRELSGPQNLMNYNRVSGMLTDILRERKRTLGSGDDTGKQALDRVEELINEAGLFASENRYDECYKTLNVAYDMLFAQIGGLSAAIGR